MKATQWLGLLFMLLIFGGITYLYLRKGAKIKPDGTRKNEDWPRTKLGGSGS
jgi:cbb3-type cytochrome oxidase subunit 3